LNHINWELVTAFDNDKLAGDIEQLVGKEIDTLSPTVTEILETEINDFVSLGVDVIKHFSSLQQIKRFFCPYQDFSA
jgi:hypothetical protein